MNLFEASGSSRTAQRRRQRREFIFARDKGRCFWCSRDVSNDPNVWPIPMNLATVDHIVPQSMGGRKNATSNMVLSCMPCNLDRGDTPADEYLAVIAKRSQDFK